MNGHIYIPTFLKELEFSINTIGWNQSSTSSTQQKAEILKICPLVPDP